MLPILQLATLFQNTRVMELVERAGNVTEHVLEDIQDAVAEGILKFSHTWTTTREAVNIKLEIESKLEPFEENEEDEWEKEIIELIFDNNKYQTIFEDLETQGFYEDAAATYYHGVDFDEEEDMDKQVFFLKKDWESFGNYAIRFLLEFKGQVEVKVLSDDVVHIIPILRRIPPYTHLTTICMGFDEMNEEDANKILKNVASVDTVIFDGYKSCLETFEAVNFYTIIFDMCPELKVEDIVKLTNPRIQITDPSNIKSNEFIRIVHNWLGEPKSALEKLTLEYIGMENDIDITKILEDYPFSCAYNKNVRDDYKKHLDLEKCHDYMHLFDIENAVDVLAGDHTLASLVKTDNATHFVVWHRQPMFNLQFIPMIPMQEPNFGLNPVSLSESNFPVLHFQTPFDL